MNKPQKAYSAYQLISVATVANTLALSRNIAGLEALLQLAEAVERGSLCADLYPSHDRSSIGLNLDLFGKPAGNSPGIWRRLAKKSVELYGGDVDDFSCPPAVSTWHLLAGDVFEFANNSTLNARAAAAMRELAIRYKPELGDFQGDVAEPDTAPAQNNATPAPMRVVGGLGGTVTERMPERRLALLIELGGSVKYSQGQWTFKGISELVAKEKASKYKRSDAKTIRADLKEAAQAERDAKSAGAFDGLGQR